MTAFPNVFPKDSPKKLGVGRGLWKLTRKERIQNQSLTIKKGIMSIKHLKIANYSRALMAQKARKQMALINQCNHRNGNKDWRPFSFGNRF